MPSYEYVVGTHHGDVVMCAMGRGRRHELEISEGPGKD